jgi:microcystin-dependent protein
VITLGTDGLVYTSKSALQSIVGVTGSITWIAGNAVPAGYLAADGASVSSASYPELYAVIGVTYGGDGSVFSLPDLRGEFIRGMDNGRGIDSSRSIGSAQADELRSHVHTNVFSSGYAECGNAYGWRLWPDNGATDAAGGIETRPRNVAFLACIKY